MDTYKDNTDNQNSNQGIDNEEIDKSPLVMPSVKLDMMQIDKFVNLISSRENEIKMEVDGRTERAQSMANWGDEYRNQFKLLPDLLREFDFTLAKAVIRLEQFEGHEYRKVDKFNFLTDSELAKRYMHISKFVTWAESYVDRKAPHQEAIFDENPKPLPAFLFRDMVAYNISPVVMRLHDTRHIHFAIGHPEGPALYYMASRGENIQRYAILISLFESIDKEEFLYPHELSIKNYFQKLGFTHVEEAMIFAGKASPEYIEHIVTEIGIKDFLEHEFPRTWRPPLTHEEDSSSILVQLNSELDRFVEEQQIYKANPKNAKYCAYRINRLPVGEEDEYGDDPKIH